MSHEKGIEAAAEAFVAACGDYTSCGSQYDGARRIIAAYLAEAQPTSEGEEREYVAAAVAFSEARASYYQNPTVGTQQDLEDTWRDFRAARSSREGGKR